MPLIGGEIEGLHEEYARRLVFVHSKENFEQKGESLNIAEESLRAMFDVFLADEYTEEDFQKVLGQQSLLRKKHSQMFREFERNNLTKNEAREKNKVFDEDIFTEIHCILGAERFERLFSITLEDALTSGI